MMIIIFLILKYRAVYLASVRTIESVLSGYSQANKLLRADNTTSSPS
jgi:hypothetical protein